MKMLARAALVLPALLAMTPPAAAQHATGSVAPSGYAPEQVCITWSGSTIGAGTLVPCGQSSGGSGGGGGAITAADGAIIGIGTLSNPAVGSSNYWLSQIYAASTGPLPAGAANIGNTGGLETPGSAATGGANRFAGKDGSGNAQDVGVSTTGVLDTARAGTANRVVTKTALPANTSQVICPAAAAPVATEIQFSAGGVGISLSGGALTQATIGAAAGTTPDLAWTTAGSTYTFPVPPTNAITAYGAAGVVTCVQTLRQ